MGPQLRYDLTGRKAQDSDPVAVTDLVLLSHIMYNNGSSSVAGLQKRLQIAVKRMR